MPIYVLKNYPSRDPLIDPCSILKCYDFLITLCWRAAALTLRNAQ
ncbi:hypothetical protein A2U01_0113660, partial [Trifolium medium]|nr:hypothetical protein [Trifolium medium]